MKSKLTTTQMRSLSLSGLKSISHSQKTAIREALENPNNAHLVSQLPQEKLALYRQQAGMNQPEAPTMKFRPSSLKAMLLRNPQALDNARQRPDLVAKMSPAVQEVMKEALQETA